MFNSTETKRVRAGGRLANVTSTKSVSRSHNFIALLDNCARYLYEISDYDICLRLTATARLACEDQESLEYADICSVAGSAYFELNKLTDCRKEWETSFRIQGERLPQDNLKVADIAFTPLYSRKLT